MLSGGGGVIDGITAESKALYYGNVTDQQVVDERNQAKQGFPVREVSTPNIRI